MSHPLHPWIDVSRAPIYVVTYPKVLQGDAEAEQRYVDEQTTMFQVFKRWTQLRREPFAIVADLSNVRWSNALNRQRAIGYLEAARQRGNPNLVCRAFVASTAMASGVVTSLFWQSPPEYPHLVTENLEEALAWAQDQMHASEPRPARESRFR